MVCKIIAGFAAIIMMISTIAIILIVKKFEKERYDLEQEIKQLKMKELIKEEK